MHFCMENLSFFVTTIFRFISVVLLLEMHFCMENLSVFLIAIFRFVFVVTTFGKCTFVRFCHRNFLFSFCCSYSWNALSYGESLSFPHSCFLWLLLEMRFCIEDLSVFVIAIFVLWNAFFMEDSLFLPSIFFVLFCFWRDFSWKCSIVWRTSPFSS